MKKNKFIISLLLLLLTSAMMLGQKTEDEFLTGDNDFDDFDPKGTTTPVEVADFSFVWSNSLDIAFANEALLKQAWDNQMEAWFNKQKDIIKSEIEKKFNKSFASYDAAKDELFLWSEKENTYRNVVAPKNTYSGLATSGFTMQGQHLESLKLLDLREAELRDGNINNSLYGFLEVGGIALKDIQNLTALNAVWDSKYSTFKTNYRTTFFNNEVYKKLQNLGTAFEQLLLVEKNNYYNGFTEKWDQLNLMQFLLHYENYKKFISPPYYYPELLELFNKFNDLDKATSPFIENYALSNSSYPSLYSFDYDLTLEIYELFQNPEDFDEASHLEAKETEKLRLEAEALKSFFDGLDTSEYLANSLIIELGITDDNEKKWLREHTNEAIEIDNYLKLHRVNGLASVEVESFAKAAFDALRNGGKIDWVDKIIFEETFVNSVAYCAYKLLKENNQFNQILDNLIPEDSNYNLKFRVGTSTGSGGHTSGSTNPNVKEITITINENLLIYSIISISETILHESVHARLIELIKSIGGMDKLDEFSSLDTEIEKLAAYYNKYGKNHNLAQHPFIWDNYVDEIAEGIESIHKLFPDNYTKFHNYVQASNGYNKDTFYKMVVKGGLSKTSYYKNLSQDDQINISNMYSKLKSNGKKITNPQTCQ